MASSTAKKTTTSNKDRPKRRVLTLEETMKMVEHAEEQVRAAERRYRMSLRLARAAAGKARFEHNGRHVEIRERDNKPFMCDINAA